MPLDLLAALERIAQARGITRHAAIREALAAYVMAHESEIQDESTGGNLI